MIADMEAARSAIGLKSLLQNPSNNVAAAADISMNIGNYTMGDIADVEAARSRIGAASVVVNVSGSVTTERDLVNAITQGIYNNQASGIPISYSTAYR
jgi:hypothetical protein